MVKSIKAGDIPKLARESRLLLLLFSSKQCNSCKVQEQDLDTLEKQYRKIDGIFFRKLNVEGKKIIVKGENGKNVDVLARLGITSVPTIKAWVKGVEVGFQFSSKGKSVNKAEGRVKRDFLFREINKILQTY